MERGSKKKIAEGDEQLKKTNEWLMFIIDATHTGTWKWNVQTGETEFNDLWANMIGYSLDELAPVSIETWKQFTHPDDLKNAYANLEKYFNGQANLYECEFRFRHKEGHWVWILDRGKVSEWDKDGKPLWMMGTHQDITRRKENEVSLKLDEARLESLLKISQHPAKGIQELLDFALEEAITLTGSKIGYIYFYDEDKKEFTLNTWSREVMQQCTVAEPLTIYQLEKTGIWGEAVRQRSPVLVNDFQAPNPLKKGVPEGHAPLLKFLTIPVFSDHRIVAVVGVANKSDDYNQSDIRQLTLMMDSVWKIVQRKEYETQLLAEKLFTQTMIDNLPGLFYLYTYPELELVQWNKNHETLLDLTSEELKGRISTEWVYPEERKKIIRAMHQVARDGFGQTEASFYKKDGTEIPFILTGVKLISDNQTYIMGFGVDVSRQKEIEETLKENAEELKQLNATKDKFFSIIAHDLRAPFASLVGFTELMADANSRFSVDEYLQYSRALNRTARSASSLLENLLQWSRLQRNMIPFEPRKINLNDFFDDFSETIGENARKKSIALSVDFPKGLILNADEMMLQSIMRNLISNALKFTNQGGIVDVKVQTESTGEVLFIVSDNGIGMDPEQLENLFRIDTNISRPGTGGEPSTGLGLILCKEFIEKHGGKIWAESNDGKTGKQGSTFYFTLPVYK